MANLTIPSQTILFTRQIHDADRTGFHYDIRLVAGDKAFSFATKKDIPEEGKSIILYEQPVHTKEYALSKRVVIPKGNYGSGTTTLDFVRKAHLEDKEGHYIMTTSDGKEKYLLKQVGKYDKTAWLFKNLGTGTEMKNKYVEKIASMTTPHSMPKFLRARKLAELIRSKYQSVKSMTPDLKGKVELLKHQLNKADDLAWRMEIQR
jgi:hypothetical protein